MQFKHKMMLGAALLSAVPVLIASFTIGSLSMERSYQTLENTARKQLVALRDAKKREIGGYFHNISQQIQNLSRSGEVVEAMQRFSKAVKTYPEEVQTDQVLLREKLAEYYAGDYQREFSQRNPGDEIDSLGLLNRLDATGIALQYRYIQANPFPLGEKDSLIEPKDGSNYAASHARYHPYFRDFQQRFGYYDLFLVDIDSGRIVYSVFKELDYATSLKDGPYADSGIGEVFRRASQARSNDFVSLTDFAPYLPSYQDPAAFVASPIFAGGKKLGVLIFQMPIDRINAVMTDNGQWQEAGLGDSGETYLLGADGRMRSISRFFQEDQKAYLQAIEQQGIGQEILDLITAKNTTIGLQPIKTEGSKTAMAGQSGFSIFPDYRGVPVLCAYAPIKLNGVQWSIFAQIDEAEAFSDARELTEDLWLYAIGISVLLLTAAVVSGLLIAKSFSRPILEFTDVITQIEQSADLTGRVQIHCTDEIGQAACAFNSMLDKLHGSMQQVADATHQLASTAEETSTITDQTNEAVQNQLSETTQLATAMTEMSATVREVAENTQNTSHATGEVTREALQGRRTMQGTTEQINQMIEKLQEGSRQAVDVMEQSQNKAKNAVEQVTQTGQSFSAITESIERISGMTIQIASAAEEQNAVAEEINRNIIRINGIAEQTSSGAKQTSLASGDLSKLATQLNGLVAQFKV